MTLGEFVAADRPVLVGVEPIECGGGIAALAGPRTTLAELAAEMFLHRGAAGLGLLLGQEAVAIGVELGEMLANLGDDLVAGLYAVGLRRHRNRIGPGSRCGCCNRRLGKGRAGKDDGGAADQKLFYMYLHSQEHAQSG